MKLGRDRSDRKLIVDQKKRNDREMLYIVLYLSDRNEMSERVKALEYPKQEFDSFSIISCKKTSDELAKELGIGTENQRGIVSAIENYSGYADKKFVEWFKVHKE